MKSCSPSWTMCSSLPKPLAALGWATTHWERSCSTTQESDFTLGKRGCGTAQVCARRGWLNWDLRSGTLKA